MVVSVFSNELIATERELDGRKGAFELAEEGFLEICDWESIISVSKKRSENIDATLYSFGIGMGWFNLEKKSARKFDFPGMCEISKSNPRRNSNH